MDVGLARYEISLVPLVSLACSDCLFLSILLVCLEALVVGGCQRFNSLGHFLQTGVGAVVFVGRLTW